MTLEDFFTLTEMKDGLTALSRVEELVTAMQKEKDCAVKNVSDASRQWTAVASTIAATENKDCLDLFIQLDGLWFIDRWLKDAQKFDTDTNASFAEESITALLQALEKLHINNERSMSSGIWITVKNLLDHKSSTVQDRARILFDSWKQERNEDASNCEVDDAVSSHDDESSKLVSEDRRPSASGIPASEGNVKSETHASAPAERGDDVEIPTDNNQLTTHNILDSADTKEGSADPPASSVVSNPVEQKPSTIGDSPGCSVEGNSVETSFPVPKKVIVEGQSDFQKANEFSKNEKQADKFESSMPTPPELDADVASPRESKKQPDLQNDFEGSENDACQKISATDCATAPASESKNMVGESRVVNHCGAAQDAECCSNALHSSVNGNMLGRPEDLETSRLDDRVIIDEDMEQASDEDRDFRIAYEFSKPVMDTKSSDAINKRRSDSELDYAVDPLEVARQVAKAVEREVFKGSFPSSSSEKTSEGGLKQPGSPDSINEKQDPPIDVTPDEVTTTQNHSAEAYSEGEMHVRNAVNMERTPENCNQEMESSQVTEAAQETEINIEKGPCSFDLNEEVCSDDMDQPGNTVSTPISVVPASRPASIPGLPVAPLQFEGTLGWKGSAATSAFRAASPRRNSDSDKNHSVGGASDSGSKQRHDFLDIDLNVAEGGDDLGKHIPTSSGLLSGESSVEVSQRSERFKLDLNRIEDDADVLPSNLTVEGQQMYNRNGHRSPSPATSSSSMQPSMRNFDLNDRPSFQDSLDQGPGRSSQTVNPHSVPKPDASVISIMGTRVEINRQDFVPQVLSLPNGKAIEPVVDAAVTRTGGFLGLAHTGSYTHSPVFGYNGLTTGPTMSLSSSMYGPSGAIPYVMDARTTIMPQNIPSASAVPPYSQPPFMMSVTNAQPGLNGAGPSRPNFDLNSGFMVEGGNRDSGLRQFFITGQARPGEEHLRTNSMPPSSSSIGGKRKEADGGWEAYQFSYKQPQPPWR